MSSTSSYFTKLSSCNVVARVAERAVSATPITLCDGSELERRRSVSWRWPTVCQRWILADSGTCCHACYLDTGRSFTSMRINSFYLTMDHQSRFQGMAYLLQDNPHMLQLQMFSSSGPIHRPRTQSPLSISSIHYVPRRTRRSCRESGG